MLKADKKRGNGALQVVQFVVLRAIKMAKSGQSAVSELLLRDKLCTWDKMLNNGFTTGLLGNVRSTACQGPELDLGL